MSDQTLPTGNELQGRSSVGLAPPETAAVNPLELQHRLEEESKDRQHRRDEETKKNDHERKKEDGAIWDRRMVRYFGILLASVALVVALVMLLRSGSTPSDRENAWRIIGIILAAFFGFAFGQYASK